jgi:hypothetical protein
MPIQIDEFTTDVFTESDSEGASPAPAASEPWRDQMSVQDAISKIRRDRSRTAAEAFDD